MTDPLAGFRLDGKTAIVTGASSGLGAGFAQALAAVGARVVVAARRLDRLEELAGRIRADGGAALAVACDVASPEDCAAVMPPGSSIVNVASMLGQVASRHQIYSL